VTVTTTAAPVVKKARRKFPVQLLEGVRPLDRKRIPLEIVAGVTLAALAIPEVMGYTSIAGMPVVTGLYTILVPIALFALLGSSRHLVVGADSATAAIMAAGLAGLAAADSSQYVALAGMLAIITGVYLLLARVFRLGFLADFLSRTVLIGFLTGVGIQVACGQFSGLFGIPKSGSGPIEQVANTFQSWSKVSWSTFAVSISVLLIIVVGGRLARRIPWALIAVIGSIVASEVWDLSSHGVTTLGTVPGGLPSVSWPSVPSSAWATLLTTAASIFVVVLAQSAATSRAYAAKFNDDFDENVDLVGLSLASISAGLTGTFPVNGSPTKTAMVDKAGGRSQLAQLVTAAIVLIVLLFLTKPLSYMPNAVLAAVVFLIGVELVDYKGMRNILRLRRAEFLIALLTAAIVVFIGVEQGIIAAIVLSIIFHLRHSYRPYDRLLVPRDDGDWAFDTLESGTQARPGLIIYSFGASLYYANANRFAEEARDLLKAASPAARWFCLHASSIDDIDFSGSFMLRVLVKELDAHGVTFVMAEVPDPVMKELERDGLVDVIGKDHIFPGHHELFAAYEALPPVAVKDDGVKASGAASAPEPAPES
jgi:sulfate permease, SulP family